ncbi:MAG: L-2-amino-thiazoline-4-carboxylic acid hydrolase [Candidatus Thorarchaeota archaeon]|jgi:hypothetical protein
MTNEEAIKFQRKMDISVEEHVRTTSSKLVSLVHELVQTLGKDKAYEIVSEWAERNMVNDIKSVVDSLEEPIHNFEDVKVLLRQWVKDLNETVETVSITEETSDKVVCIVTECVQAKVFNDLGAPDIGHLLICKHDFAATPAIHPNVGLRRTKTLMESHDCCNFEYYWDDQK